MTVKLVTCLSFTLIFIIPCFFDRSCIRWKMKKKRISFIYQFVFVLFVPDYNFTIFVIYSFVKCFVCVIQHQ